MFEKRQRQLPVLSSRDRRRQQSPALWIGDVIVRVSLLVFDDKGICKEGVDLAPFWLEKLSCIVWLPMSRSGRGFRRPMMVIQ